MPISERTDVLEKTLRDHDAVRDMFVRRRREILLLRATYATVSWNAGPAGAAQANKVHHEQTAEEREYVILRQIIKKHHIHLTGPRVLRFWGIGYAWESTLGILSFD